MLSQEQAEQIKHQLFEQVDSSNLQNKEQIKEQIQNMNESQLEEFLKQQQMQAAESEPKCIFCSITNNDIHSYKIAENKKAIAILEINPVSKGHSIILPLEHISTDKLPASALGLAKKVTKKIKSKLNPEDIKIETTSFQGHAMINIIPIYKNEKLEKRKAEESELEELKSLLEIKKRGTRIKKEKEKTTASTEKSLPKISFRIP